MLLVSSCRKHTKGDVDDDTTEASDHTFAENVSNDIINIGSQAADNTSGSINSYKTVLSEEALSYCATVKRDTVNHIDSVIFNNSTCLDGRTRSGVLIFNYSSSSNGAKHYRDPGFKCVVTSVAYSVDGNQVNIINKTIENTTAPDFNFSTTNLTWSIKGHIQVTKPNGMHDFTYSRTKILLNTNDASVYHGAATPISWHLAKVGITGSASGTSAKGRNYTVTITNQLIRDFGACLIGKKHPFIQGSFEFAPSGKAIRYVDFGNGTCDLDASVTINGVSHAITLQ